MSGLYPWIKAIHVVAVISWMAGLLYLPRLFVYHTRAAVGSEASEQFKVMERRLMHAITIPAGTVAWCLGLVMASQWGLAGHGWLHAKLGLVCLLSAVNFLLELRRRDFAKDRNRHSARYFRLVNEVPTLLMVGIVILVIVKPF